MVLAIVGMAAATPSYFLVEYCCYYHLYNLCINSMEGNMNEPRFSGFSVFNASVIALSFVIGFVWWGVYQFQVDATPPIVGAIYCQEEDNPFVSTYCVTVVDVRKGYVKWKIGISGTATGTIRQFNYIYKLKGENHGN